MSEHTPIEIRIDSDPKHLCVVRAAVEQAAMRSGFDEKQAGQIMLAVDEALTNIIRHGYKGACDKPIWIKLRTVAGRDRGLEIVIEDQAADCDPATFRGRDLDDIRPGGLGTHIIRSTMDSTEYTRRPGGEGIRLTMRRYLDDDEAKREPAA